MFYKYLYIIPTICLLFVATAWANQTVDGAHAGSFGNYDVVLASSKASDHAPIGMMGEHTHKKGEWMLSYRYMTMHMKENLEGHERIDTPEIHGTFAVAPISMNMDMHMFGVMYAPTDFLTLMLMVPLLDIEMDHLTRMGVTFTTKSRGLGDLKLTGLIPIYESKEHRHKFLFKWGMSFPTGSISVRDDTPAAFNARLPYPMQRGSGTYDLRPGINYSGREGHWTWGADANAIFRLGRNHRDYALGDRYDASIWGARDWADWMSTSVRLHYQIWNNIRGRDDALNPGMVPTANPKLRGGRRIDIAIGLNLIAPEALGILKGNRLAIEAGWPIMQSLNGPQLETRWFLTAGWQLAFG